MNKSVSSLLTPHKKPGPGIPGVEESRRLSDDAVQDLDISRIVDSFTVSPQARRLVERSLTQLPVDPETVQYRQETFRFLWEHPELRARLRDIIPKIRELTVFSHSHRAADSPFLGAIWRIGELDLYLECLDGLFEAFESAQPPGDVQALSALFHAVAAQRSSEPVEALRTELPPLKAGLRKRRSVTIGINLDERLRPIEAKLVSVHERPFVEYGLLTGFFRSLRGKERKGQQSGENAAPGRDESPGDSRGIATPLHKTVGSGDERSGLSGEKMPLSPLFQDLEGIMRATAKRVLTKVESFLGIETQFLQELPDQLEFFLGAADLADRLRDGGLPAGIPEIEPVSARRLAAEEVYNLALAIRRHPGMETKGASTPEAPAGDGNGEQVVTNDISIGDATIGAIITGPNRGGKTTYLQAVGQLQVLAQAGLFVAARSARVSPVDYLATHFPQREHSATELGRFGEEIARLSRIFDQLSADSIVLLNESFASTNPTEAIAFGEEVLKALGKVGTRCLVATHLLDMARSADRLGPFSTLTAKIETNGEGARRTFKIVPGLPRDTSYAYDLVRQAGMTYEQLTARLENRGVIPESHSEQ